MVGYSPWGCKDLETAEATAHVHTWQGRGGRWGHGQDPLEKAQTGKGVSWQRSREGSLVQTSGKSLGRGVPLRLPQGPGEPGGKHRRSCSQGRHSTAGGRDPESGCEPILPALFFLTRESQAV